MQPQSELPDLPALESVEQRDFSFLMLPLAYSGFLIFIVFGAVRCLLDYRQYLQSREVSLLVLLLSMFVFLPFRILSGFASFRTDTTGFHARGPLRRKFIPWTEITAASIRKTWAKDTLLTLRTRRGSFSVAPRGFSASVSATDCLLASVWQHLRRLGKGDGIVPTPAMLSLWEDIPDDVPAEMDWGKPPSLGAKIGSLCMLTLLGGGMLYLLVAVEGPIVWRVMMGSMVLGFAAMLKWMMIPEVLHQAYRVRVGRDGIEADVLLKQVYIPWSDVEKAGWKGRGLRIAAGCAKKEIRVPYYLGSKGSEKLILAAIRYLRTAGVPQAITWPTLISRDPDQLNQPAYSGSAKGRLALAFLNTLEEPAQKRLQTLRSRQALLAISAFMLPMILVFAGAAEKLSAWLHGGYDLGVRYFIAPSPIVIAIPLMFACAILSSFVEGAISRRLAGPYREEWERLQQIGSGGKLNRALGYVACGIGLLGIIAAPLFVDCYLRVTDKGMAVNTLTEFRERFYNWQDVRGIDTQTERTEHQGHTDTSLTYIVRFADGRQWRSEQGMTVYTNFQKIPEAVEFISAKTGKKIQYR